MTGLATIATRNGRSLASLASRHSLPQTTPILTKLGISIRYWSGHRGTTNPAKKDSGRLKTWAEKAFKRTEEDTASYAKPTPIEPIVDKDGTIIYKRASPLQYSGLLRKKEMHKAERKGLPIDTTIPTDLIDMVAEVTTRKGKDRLTKRGSPESIINLTKNERAMRQMLVRYAKTHLLPTGGYPNIYIVGGWVRDKILGVDSDIPNVNIVVEGMEATRYAASLTEYIRNYGNSLGKANTGVDFSSFNGVRIKKVHPETGRLVSKKELEADFDDEAKFLNSAEAILYDIYVEMRSLRTRQQTYAEASIAEDALFRDATINALYYSLNWKSLHDPTGKGLSDLYDKVLRPPIDATKCFENDPVRALRYIRLACSHDFTIAPEAMEVINSEWLRKALREAPREYVNAELDTLFKSGNVVAKAAQMIRDCNLYDSIFDLEMTEKENSGIWNYDKEVPQTHQITPPNYDIYPTAVQLTNHLLDHFTTAISPKLQPILHLHSPLLYKLAFLSPYAQSGLLALKTTNQTLSDLPFYNHALVRAHRVGLRPGYSEETIVRCAVRDYDEIRATAAKLSADPSSVPLEEVRMLYEKWRVSSGTHQYGSIEVSISYALLTALTSLTPPGTPVLLNDTPEKRQLIQGFETLTSHLLTLNLPLPTKPIPLWKLQTDRELAEARSIVPTPYDPKPATKDHLQTFTYRPPTSDQPEDTTHQDYQLRKRGQMINQQMKHFGPRKVPVLRFISHDKPHHSDSKQKDGEVIDRGEEKWVPVWKRGAVKTYAVPEADEDDPDVDAKTFARMREGRQDYVIPDQWGPKWGQKSETVAEKVPSLSWVRTRNDVPKRKAREREEKEMRRQERDSKLGVTYGEDGKYYEGNGAEEGSGQGGDGEDGGVGQPRIKREVSNSVD